MKAILVLEDGFSLQGEAFGATGGVFGEAVFNTAMTGYQEILTDPSYKGQIVTMTYPLIGNYGVNDEDVESCRIWAEGFVVKENSALYSNWRAGKSLDAYLKAQNVVGISGVDTRALTRHIRLKGAMKAGISSKDFDKEDFLKKVKASPGMEGRDLIPEVTCKEMYQWNPTGKHKVVAMDFGAKLNILRLLAAHNCCITVVPSTTKAETILKMQPDGLFLSNGPGDPAALGYIIAEIKNLLDKFPIFGICLGHQLLGLAFGGKTYKLKFGHHGANHPVMNLANKKVEITSQNHGFNVDMRTLDEKEIETTHINLYDHTAEGLRHKRLPVFSVQYHPEASPGPHDSRYLFEHFVSLMKNAQKN
ncbi:MAG: glutamine-hydrolyzing carbamoyl-phosphate synthase small subunit [Candidatus Omnitrophota bacterium]